VRSGRAISNVGSSQSLDNAATSLSKEIIVLDYGDEVNNPYDDADAPVTGNCK
jgi:hypothetical protein